MTAFLHTIMLATEIMDIIMWVLLAVIVFGAFVLAFARMLFRHPRKHDEDEATDFDRYEASKRESDAKNLERLARQGGN